MKIDVCLCLTVRLSDIVLVALVGIADFGEPFYTSYIEFLISSQDLDSHSSDSPGWRIGTHF